MRYSSLAVIPASPPQVTSLFLHIVPALVSWSLRWHPEPPGQFQDCIPPPPPTLLQTGASSGHLGADLWGHVLLPMTLYVLWSCLYYLQIFVFKAKKIQQRGYQTLFKYVTSQKRGIFHAISKRVPSRLQPQVGMLHSCLPLYFPVPCLFDRIYPLKQPHFLSLYSSPSFSAGILAPPPVLLLVHAPPGHPLLAQPPSSHRAPRSRRLGSHLGRRVILL